jgi:hypothetical protein
MNVKPDGQKRKQCLYMMEPEAMSYIDEKGKLFETKGGRGGKSEALNQIVLMMKKLEPYMGKFQELMENE